MLNQLCSSASIPENGTYTGPARICFGSPKGEITGPGTIKLSADGHLRIRVEVEQYSIPAEYGGFLMPFVQGAIPKKSGTGVTTMGIGSSAQTIEAFELTSEHGKFQASRALVSNSHFELFGNGNAWIEIVANDLQLVVGERDVHNETVWSMPLFGNLAEFKSCANACWVDGRSAYIHFDTDGYRCGIAFPTDGANESTCTAVVFGEVGERPHTEADEVRGLLPWGLISALDFAVGSDITSPWLELRDHDGHLKRRIHQRAGTSHQDDGFATFSKVDSLKAGSGIAGFLRCFFDLPQQQRRSLGPSMNLIRSGAPGSATIDESITDLVKALDAMCIRHKIGRQNLMQKLGPHTSNAVLQVIKDGREKFLQIRKQCKTAQDLGQLAVIDKIVSRQSNVANDELDFGLCVTALLVKFGLHDSAAMNSYYSQLPGHVTWEGLLSSVRGQVIHAGAIPINARNELVEWFEFARHLHDICKRIILREIGYSGTYHPSNVLFSGEYELDRVTPKTTVGQLGYKVPPTPV